MSRPTGVTSRNSLKEDSIKLKKAAKQRKVYGMAIVGRCYHNSLNVVTV